MPVAPSHHSAAPHKPKRADHAPISGSRAKIFKLIGIAGAVVCLAVFINRPSWPTPDKLLVFLAFVFMCFGQALEMLKRFVPFVGLLLIYESFRSIVPKLNSHVHYTWMPHADRAIFGQLPTITLQHWLWHGHVMWYDFAFYIFYMLHFIFPIGLAVAVWKLRESYYWRYVATYVVLSFAGFLTYLLFPAAPPWMASDAHVIPHITRISSFVWARLGIKDFPSFYNHISPNPVAAVPSLHAAYATLFVIFVTKLFGKKWGALACIYPFMIYVGTVYQGEHYAVDAILGIIYAVAAYYITAWSFQKLIPKLRLGLSRFDWLKDRLSGVLPTLSKD